MKGGEQGYAGYPQHEEAECEPAIAAHGLRSAAGHLGTEIQLGNEYDQQVADQQADPEPVVFEDCHLCKPFSLGAWIGNRIRPFPQGSGRTGIGSTVPMQSWTPPGLARRQTGHYRPRCLPVSIRCRGTRAYPGMSRTLPTVR